MASGDPGEDGPAGGAPVVRGATALVDGEPGFGPWRAASLAELLDVVRAAAGSRERPADRPLVVAVDGRGGGGKSSLAGRLAALVRGAAVVATDDVAWHHSFFDWHELLAEHVLGPARRGEDVAFRPPAWEERGRPGAVRVPVGTPLLLVEGVGAGRQALSDVLDAVLWVQSDHGEAERRGIERDVAQGVNGDRDEATRFWHEWQAHERPFLARDRPWERACAVVAGTPVPGVPLPDGHVLLADPSG